MGRHHCAMAAIGECSEHTRTIWGDLLPVEQYRNGNDGRHSQTNPFSNQPTPKSIARRLTTQEN